jgi:hypothetical protein
MRLWFTDVLGFLKVVHDHLAGARGRVRPEGMGFDGSSIDGFSRIQESDMVAVPDPATFQLIPWKSEAEVAGCSATVLEPGRLAFEGDPRFVLKRKLKRAADLGYTFLRRARARVLLLQGAVTAGVPGRAVLRRDPLDLADRTGAKRTVAYSIDGDPRRVRASRGGAQPARDRPRATRTRLRWPTT